MKCSKCGSTTNLSKGAAFIGETVIIGKDDVICDKCHCEAIKKNTGKLALTHKKL